MGFEPVVEVTRGGVVESVHHGAVAVADVVGRLVAWAGDPETVTFLRSSAKPFQALPLIEIGAADAFGITPRELAVICASHSGTDEHVRVVGGLQARIGITESDLLCGVHMPYDPETARRMRAEGLQATPNQHNCSGKHTGMLAQARHRGEPLVAYTDANHPVQQRIAQAFAEMAGLEAGQVRLGVDGCSVPTFAVPLRAAAQAYARLADPATLAPARAQASRRVFVAMTSHPELVAGPGRFDTHLMQATGGRVLSKGGAEGYRGMAIPPGAIGSGSPALGIAIKVSDGDLGRPTDSPPGQRAGGRVALAVLRQLEALRPDELDDLAEFGTRSVANWRGLVVGEIRACVRLQRAG